MPNEKLYKGDSKLMDIIQRCTSMKPSERYEVEEVVDLLGYKISNITQTSHTPNGVSTLKIQYFS